MDRAVFLLSLSCASLVYATLPAGAAAPSSGSCVLSEPERRTVAEVKDGETLSLTDGTTVRLIGAKAPSVPASGASGGPTTLAAATEATRALAEGAEIELRYGGTRSDRHGRALAHVFLVKGDERVWLQGEMVGRGFARAYSYPDNRACMAELLAIEAEAREKRLGLWRHETYAILDAADAKRIGELTRSFQLVEGVVAAIGTSRTRLYVNFDKDWRRDFTISVPLKDEKDFGGSRLDLRSLAGKRIRVRGWVEWYNGPMIDATHAEQIEILPAVSQTKAIGREEGKPL
jgi:micrococcal nuclease